MMKLKLRTENEKSAEEFVVFLPPLLIKSGDDKNLNEKKEVL